LESLFLALLTIGVTAAITVVSTLVYFKRRGNIVCHPETNPTRGDLLEAVPDALIITSQDGRIISCNNRAQELFGYTAKEFNNLTVEDLLPLRFRELHKHQRKSFHADPAVRSMGMGRDLSILRKDGTEVETEIALGFSRGPDDEVQAIVLLYDITERKKAERKIRHLAYHDVLTDLPNRVKFYEHAKHSIERARKNDWNIAFFIVDIDDFKRINDTLGFHVGDEILKKAAHLLRNVISDHCNNEMDCCCFSARLGGDEFALLLERIKDVDDLHKIAKELFHLFEQPMYIINTNVKISISVGISMMPQHGLTTSTLLKAADLALVTAQRAGKNQFFIHDKSMATKVDEFIRYNDAIKGFIEKENFEVHFQPVVNAKTMLPLGAETLFRGNEKEHGKLDLEFLIDVAEDTGLIVDLGAKIFKRACVECLRCEMLGPERIVSVNASIRQLEDPGFVDMCIHTMEELGVQPHNMAIEVTETMMMLKQTNIVAKLEVLKDYGVKIFIDDFGKGYSSYSQIRHLPADKLKLDMSFVKDVASDSKTAAIVKGIIDMAHALDLRVCAEGVESEDQLITLKSLDVDQVQGYYIGEPMSIDDFHKQYARYF